MRKLVVAGYVTLDGVMQDPGGVGEIARGGWSKQYWSDELAEYQYDCLVASDALVLGRVTYEGFAAAWPDMAHEGDFAVRMNGHPKYLVSTTLTHPGWNNSHVVKGDVPGEITKLKQQPDRNILVYGSGQLVRTLLQHGLVDELRLMVHPVVLGTDKRLFEDGTSAALKPTATRTFSTGVIALTYEAARG